MKLKFFHVLFVLFFVVWIPFSASGNTNSRAYCENLSDSATKEYSKGNYVKSLEYLIEVKAMAENNSWEDLQIKILNTMGRIYSTVLDYNKAMEYYMQGYRIALKTSDENRQMQLLNNIGVLYSTEKDYKKSYDYVKQAYGIAKHLNDTLKMGRFTVNLAIIAHKMKNLDLAEKYINVSFNLLKNNTDNLDYALVQIVKAENLYMKADYDRSEKLALEIYDQIDTIRYENVKSQFLLILSKIYHQQKDFQKAIYFAEKSLSDNPKLTTRIEIYEDLAKIYQEKKMYLPATQYKDSVIALNDSLNRLNDFNRVANNQIRFDLLHLESKFMANEEKQRMERILFICIIIFFFVLLLVLMGILRIRSIRNKQKLREQEISAQLNEARRSKEIEIKNKELAAKVLFQSNKNELIEEIIDKLSAIPIQWRDNILESTIHQLKIQLKDSAQNESFLIYFEQVNPEFVAALQKKYPHLTADEIRFLSYIYIGLSSKEIAKLLNITFDYYRQKKHRLSTKMGIDTNALYTYLVNEVTGS